MTRIRPGVTVLVMTMVAGTAVLGIGLLSGVPVSRAVQWGLLAAASALALAGVARLPVQRPRWPAPPETPVGVGWHGLRSAEERMRQEATVRRVLRRSGRVRGNGTGGAGRAGDV